MTGIRWLCICMVLIALVLDTWVDRHAGAIVAVVVLTAWAAAECGAWIARTELEARD